LKMKDSASGKNYFASMDSLRGLAAMTVVLFHFQLMPIWSSIRWIRKGALLVDFFFVLSGFVIALSYARKINSAQTVWDFQKKRFWRLYPLHLVILLVYLLVECAIYWVSLHPEILQLASNPQPFKVNNLGTFFSNLFLVQAMNLHKGLSFNGPSWSISVEFYTYLLFALVVWFAGPKRWVKACAVMSVLGALTLVALDAPLTSYYDYGFFRCIYSFFAGACCFAIYDRYKDLDWQVSPLKLSALMGVTVMFVMYAKGYLQFALPPLYGMVILGLLFENGSKPINRVLMVAPLRYLGRISYSLYMTHILIWYFFNLIFIDLWPLPMKANKWGNMQFDLPIWQQLAYSVAGLAIVIGVSELTYRWIEDRFRIKSKRKVELEPQVAPQLPKDQTSTAMSS